MTEALLNDLNDSQRQAVKYCDGPQLVIAGAGSGKTRVLTYKIAYLIAHGMNPWNILALTFTKKAANEMKSRIGDLVGHDKARQIYMGTFHSIFARILRSQAAAIGYQTNYTIYDETDARSLLKNIIKEMSLDDKIYKPSLVMAQISKAKNRLVTAAQYALDTDAMERDRFARIPRLHEIYTLYSARCRSANAMDFDDLLLNTYLLFQSNDDVRRDYAARFRHVLVDEYQDTNHAQQAIIHQLTREHQRLTVVGDDAQSIYAFRGADIDNILTFQHIYPDSRLFKLEQNYRSTQHIVQAADSLIKKNSRQIPKDLYSLGGRGEKLQFRQACSDKEEACIVGNQIRRIRKAENAAYSHFAILYRTNAQSRAFEEEFRRQGIPYRIYGGLSFYQRKEIKDVIAYLRLIVNPHDEEAFRRIINYPARGIGSTTLQKISETAQRDAVSLWTVAANPEAHELAVSSRTISKITAFSQLIDTFRQQAEAPDVTAWQIAQTVITASGIEADILGSRDGHVNVDPDSLERRENLQELLAGIQAFVDTRTQEGLDARLADYLQEVVLVDVVDVDDNADTDRVSLMTIHAAKGLEYPTVFVVGLEENILPSAMSAASLRQLEEERRLLYVAITRARRHCILTCAKNRWRYGKMEIGSPSRFLRDIDPRFIESPSPISHSPSLILSGNLGNLGNSGNSGNSWCRPPSLRAIRETRGTTPSSLVSHPSSLKREGEKGDLCPGTVIEHQRFGIGTVVKVEGQGENTKATVEFQDTGTKQLLLKFAKYKIVRRA